MADRVGEQFGQYRLSCFLGQGSFGEVYLGEHIYNHTLAAVKILQARLTAEDLKEFINEASTTFRLQHPHIVRLLDFGIGSADTPFLVMAYAANGTLRKLHPKGTRLPLQSIIAYVNPIASALQHAHDQRLIHRDVKPENILLGPIGTIMRLILLPEVIAPPLSPMACSPRLRVRVTSVMSRSYRVGSFSTTFLARRSVRFETFERSRRNTRHRGAACASACI